MRPATAVMNLVPEQSAGAPAANVGGIVKIEDEDGKPKTLEYVAFMEEYDRLPNTLLEKVEDGFIAIPFTIAEEPEYESMSEEPSTSSYEEIIVDDYSECDEIRAPNSTDGMLVYYEDEELVEDEDLDESMEVDGDDQSYESDFTEVTYDSANEKEGGGKDEEISDVASIRSSRSNKSSRSGSRSRGSRKRNGENDSLQKPPTRPAKPNPYGFSEGAGPSAWSNRPPRLGRPPRPPMVGNNLKPPVASVFASNSGNINSNTATENGESSKTLINNNTTKSLLDSPVSEKSISDTSSNPYGYRDIEITPPTPDGCPPAFINSAYGDGIPYANPLHPPSDGRIQSSNQFTLPRQISNEQNQYGYGDENPYGYGDTVVPNRSSSDHAASLESVRRASGESIDSLGCGSFGDRRPSAEIFNPISSDRGYSGDGYDSDQCYPPLRASVAGYEYTRTYGSGERRPSGDNPYGYGDDNSASNSKNLRWSTGNTSPMRSKARRRSSIENPFGYGDASDILATHPLPSTLERPARRMSIETRFGYGGLTSANGERPRMGRRSSIENPYGYGDASDLLATRPTVGGDRNTRRMSVDSRLDSADYSGGASNNPGIRRSRYARRRSVETMGMNSDELAVSSDHNIRTMGPTPRRRSVEVSSYVQNDELVGGSEHVSRGDIPVPPPGRAPRRRSLFMNSATRAAEEEAVMREADEEQAWIERERAKARQRELERREAEARLLLEQEDALASDRREIDAKLRAEHEAVKNNDSAHLREEERKIRLAVLESERLAAEAAARKKEELGKALRKAAEEALAKLEEEKRAMDDEIKRMEFALEEARRLKEEARRKELDEKERLEAKVLAKRQAAREKLERERERERLEEQKRQKELQRREEELRRKQEELKRMEAIRLAEEAKRREEEIVARRLAEEREAEEREKARKHEEEEKRRIEEEEAQLRAVEAEKQRLRDLLAEKQREFRELEEREREEALMREQNEMAEEEYDGDYCDDAISTPATIEETESPENDAKDETIHRIQSELHSRSDSSGDNDDGTNAVKDDSKNASSPCKPVSQPNSMDSSSISLSPKKSFDAVVSECRPPLSPGKTLLQRTTDTRPKAQPLSPNSRQVPWEKKGLDELSPKSPTPRSPVMALPVWSTKNASDNIGVSPLSNNGHPSSPGKDSKQPIGLPTSPVSKMLVGAKIPGEGMNLTSPTRKVPDWTNVPLKPLGFTPGSPQASPTKKLPPWATRALKSTSTKLVSLISSDDNKTDGHVGKSRAPLNANTGEAKILTTRPGSEDKPTITVVSSPQRSLAATVSSCSSRTGNDDGEVNDVDTQPSLPLLTTDTVKIVGEITTTSDASPSSLSRNADAGESTFSNSITSAVQSDDERSQDKVPPLPGTVLSEPISQKEMPPEKQNATYGDGNASSDVTLGYRTGSNISQENGEVSLGQKAASLSALVKAEDTANSHVDISPQGNTEVSLGETAPSSSTQVKPEDAVTSTVDISSRGNAEVSLLPTAMSSITQVKAEDTAISQVDISSQHSAGVSLRQKAASSSTEVKALDISSQVNAEVSLRQTATCSSTELKAEEKATPHVAISSGPANMSGFLQGDISSQENAEVSRQTGTSSSTEMKAEGKATSKVAISSGPARTSNSPFSLEQNLMKLKKHVESPHVVKSSCSSFVDRGDGGSVASLRNKWQPKKFTRGGSENLCDSESVGSVKNRWNPLKIAKKPVEETDSESVSSVKNRWQPQNNYVKKAALSEDDKNGDHATVSSFQIQLKKVATSSVAARKKSEPSDNADDESIASATSRMSDNGARHGPSSKENPTSQISGAPAFSKVTLRNTFKTRADVQPAPESSKELLLQTKENLKDKPEPTDFKSEATEPDIKVQDETDQRVATAGEKNATKDAEEELSKLKSAEVTASRDDEQSNLTTESSAAAEKEVPNGARSTPRAQDNGLAEERIKEDAEEIHRKSVANARARLSAEKAPLQVESKASASASAMQESEAARLRAEVDVKASEEEEMRKETEVRTVAENERPMTEQLRIQADTAAKTFADKLPRQESGGHDSTKAVDAGEKELEVEEALRQKPKQLQRRAETETDGRPREDAENSHSNETADSKCLEAEPKLSAQSLIARAKLRTQKIVAEEQARREAEELQRRLEAEATTHAEETTGRDAEELSMTMQTKAAEKEHRHCEEERMKQSDQCQQLNAETRKMEDAEVVVYSTQDADAKARDVEARRSAQALVEKAKLRAQKIAVEEKARRETDEIRRQQAEAEAQAFAEDMARQQEEKLRLARKAETKEEAQSDVELAHSRKSIQWQAESDADSKTKATEEAERVAHTNEEAAAKARDVEATSSAQYLIAKAKRRAQEIAERRRKEAEDKGWDHPEAKPDSNPISPTKSKLTMVMKVSEGSPRKSPSVDSPERRLKSPVKAVKSSVVKSSLASDISGDVSDAEGSQVSPTRPLRKVTKMTKEAVSEEGNLRMSVDSPEKRLKSPIKVLKSSSASDVSSDVSDTEGTQKSPTRPLRKVTKLTKESVSEGSPQKSLLVHSPENRLTPSSPLANEMSNDASCAEGTPKSPTKSLRKLTKITKAPSAESEDESLGSYKKPGATVKKAESALPSHAALTTSPTKKTNVLKKVPVLSSPVKDASENSETENITSIQQGLKKLTRKVVKAPTSSTAAGEGYEPSDTESIASSKQGLRKVVRKVIRKLPSANASAGISDAGPAMASASASPAAGEAYEHSDTESIASSKQGLKKVVRKVIKKAPSTNAPEGVTDAGPGMALPTETQKKTISAVKKTPNPGPSASNNVLDEAKETSKQQSPTKKLVRKVTATTAPSTSYASEQSDTESIASAKLKSPNVHKKVVKMEPVSNAVDAQGLPASVDPTSPLGQKLQKVAAVNKNTTDIPPSAEHSEDETSASSPKKKIVRKIVKKVVRRVAVGAKAPAPATDSTGTDPSTIVKENPTTELGAKKSPSQQLKGKVAAKPTVSATKVATKSKGLAPSGDESLDSAGSVQEFRKPGTTQDKASDAPLSTNQEPAASTRQSKALSPVGKRSSLSNTLKKVPSSPILSQTSGTRSMSSTGSDTAATSPRSPRKMLSARSIVSTNSESTVSTFYSADELRNKIVPGLDYENIEKYLTPQEFKLVFGCTQEQYASFPKWRQTQLRRHAGFL